jgi:hypothetical protein
MILAMVEISGAIPLTFRRTAMPGACILAPVAHLAVSCWKDGRFQSYPFEARKTGKRLQASQCWLR